LIHKDHLTEHLPWPEKRKYLATLFKEKPAALTLEEYEHLINLIPLICEPSVHRDIRAQRQAVRLATLYLLLRERYPDKQTKYIEGIVADAFQCSVGAVRRDVRLAKKGLGNALPW
jgi:hypothetical protein